jgi:hypothetical protein
VASKSRADANPGTNRIYAARAFTRRCRRDEASFLPESKCGVVQKTTRNKRRIQNLPAG